MLSIPGLAVMHTVKIRAMNAVVAVMPNIPFMASFSPLKACNYSGCAFAVDPE
jgi:hypothetical protein